MQNQAAADATDAGWPMALLDARYALKRSLRDNLQVGFSIVPIQPNLDCAPLPLYESARMATDQEEAMFEKWLITNEELCRDLAEFATFAHALRTGALEPPKTTDRKAQINNNRSSVFDEIRPRNTRLTRLTPPLVVAGVLSIFGHLGLSGFLLEPSVMSNTEVLTSPPSPWTVDPDTLLQLRLSHAQNLFKNEQFHAALVEAEELLAQEPGHMSALKLVAEHCADHRRRHIGRRSIQRTTRITPHRPRLLGWLGNGAVRPCATDH